eukprot:2744087-Ditylum_brightwellii.AAC.3
MAHLSAKDKITLKGVTTINKKTELLTLVSIKFVITKTTKVFPLRKTFISLVAKFKSTDKELRISVTVSKSNGASTTFQAARNLRTN